MGLEKYSYSFNPDKRESEKQRQRWEENITRSSGKN
jgi:hypothetical protein